MKTTCSSFRSETLIDAPVEHVWKCIFEFPKFAKTIKGAEVISGGWQPEGGVVLITKHDWVGLDPFYSVNLRMRPYKQMVYKLDTKDGDQVNAFVDLTFSESEGQTKVVYSNYVIKQSAEEIPTSENDDKIAEESLQLNYFGPLGEYVRKTMSGERDN